MTKVRAMLPRLWAGLMAFLFFVNAFSLRFAPTTDMGAPSVQAFTPYLLSLTNRLSARELAWAALVCLGLWRREFRLVGFLLLMRALIESQDIATLTLALLQGQAAPAQLGVVAAVLILVILHLLAARTLLRQAKAD